MADATDCESVYCGFKFHLSPHQQQVQRLLGQDVDTYEAHYPFPTPRVVRPYPSIFCGTAGGSGFSHSVFTRVHASSTLVGATNISEWLNGHG